MPQPWALCGLQLEVEVYPRSLLLPFRPAWPPGREVPPSLGSEDSPGSGHCWVGRGPWARPCLGRWVAPEMPAGVGLGRVPVALSPGSLCPPHFPSSHLQPVSVPLTLPPESLQPRAPQHWRRVHVCAPQVCVRVAGMRDAGDDGHARACTSSSSSAHRRAWRRHVCGVPILCVSMQETMYV